MRNGIRVIKDVSAFVETSRPWGSREEPATLIREGRVDAHHVPARDSGSRRT